MATENPRPEKVAIVEEIKAHFDDASAVVLTEYRGLNVPQQAQLRAAVKDAGGHVKIYKNTLARRAADEAGIDLGDMLVGPTAIAFVGPDADGNPGDPVALAKALQNFADENEAFVVKGGLMDGAPVDDAGVKALSKVPPREEMLARFAGLLQAPMSKMAALLQAPLQNFAGLVKALEEAGGGSAGAGSDDAAADEASADEASADEASAEAAEAAPAEENDGDAAGDTDEAGSDNAADEAGSEDTADDDAADAPAPEADGDDAAEGE